MQFTIAKSMRLEILEDRKNSTPMPLSGEEFSKLQVYAIFFVTFASGKRLNTRRPPDSTNWRPLEPNECQTNPLR